MKTKRVKQYICDFCNKKGLSSGHMKKHEKHCTKNPNRDCRMCIAASGAMPDMKELLLLMPKPVVHADDPMGDRTPINIKEINKAIEKVREESEGCPACILSALRQKNICVPTTNFDYKKEVKEFWLDHNDYGVETQAYYGNY